MRREDYIKTIIVDGQMVNIGQDDYGQCYYFEYVNEDGELEEMSCGSYNFNWEQEVRDYFDILKRHKEMRD